MDGTTARIIWTTEIRLNRLLDKNMQKEDRMLWGVKEVGLSWEVMRIGVGMNMIKTHFAKFSKIY